MHVTQIRACDSRNLGGTAEIIRPFRCISYIERDFFYYCKEGRRTVVKDKLKKIHEEALKQIEASDALEKLNEALGERDIFKRRNHGQEVAAGDMLLLTEGSIHMALGNALDHAADGAGQIFTIKHLTALSIDDLTLGIHDIVVFQNALTRLEMTAFHSFLCIFNGTGENLCINGDFI